MSHMSKMLCYWKTVLPSVTKSGGFLSWNSEYLLEIFYNKFISFDSQKVYHYNIALFKLFGENSENSE